MKLPTLRIGTRGSALAIAQAEMFEAHLKKHFPEIPLRRVIVKTTGDKRQDIRLAELSGAVGSPVDKGIFTKELETALRARRVDIAVHSLKDVPTEIDSAFAVAGVMRRAPVEDVVLTRVALSDGLTSLPPQAVVATSSLRRRCQLLALRPDLQVVEIRGNVPTRMEKLRDQSELDAIVLARAGLERLGWCPISGSVEIGGRTLFTHVLKESDMLPAAGQGAVGLEIRADDTRCREILGALTDFETWSRVRCEREFLRLLQAGCHTPVGISTQVQGILLTAQAVVFSESGGPVVRAEARGWAEKPEALAADLFAALR